MKIVHLSPGSGDDFYCENCLRDAVLVRALRQAGHDASVVPLYLPLMTGEGDPGSGRRVFFGGINVYLQQKSALFRRTPRWLDRIFDSPRLLHWAGKKAGMTSARQVGEMMLSMLRGEHGRQVKELDRLVEFLATYERPDAVLISNALLLGLARRIKQALSVPVVCSLQDEEGYVESLVEPYRTEAWRILRRRAGDVDAFIAPSRFYRDVMRRRLGLADERLCVIPNAIDPGELAPRSAPPAVPAIGYLAQMCAGKGLDTLAEAFCLLKRSGRWAELKLRVFGGATAADEPFVAKVRRRLERAGLAGEVDFRADFASASKRDFLHACTVVSVPTRQGEAFGLFLLEAWACGVPVVLPEHGAFVELLADGGGLLCPPNDPPALAEALDELLADADRAAHLGRQGRQILDEKYTMARMARQAEELLERLRGGRSAGGGRTIEQRPLRKADAMGETNTLLKLIDVEKAYDSPAAAEGPSVLRGVNLAVEAGEALAIVGPSGSGKSTLLNVIGTLDRPTAGQVLLDGRDLAEMDERALARLRSHEIGFVFQLHHLLPQCTILENVLLPTLAARDGRDPAEADAAARRLLDRVGLSARLGYRPGELSGGERQRAAVVRALINSPKLLLADEPTGSLDRASAENLGRLLVELNRDEGVTLIVVTHSVELARLMGRVLELADGVLRPMEGPA